MTHTPPEDVAFAAEVARQARLAGGHVIVDMGDNMMRVRTIERILKEHHPDVTVDFKTIQLTPTDRRPRLADGVDYDPTEY